MQITAAEFVIRKFSGLTATAKAIDTPVTTVQGWKDRGTIPQGYWRSLIHAAEQRGEILALDDFLAPHEAADEQASAA